MSNTAEKDTTFTRMQDATAEEFQVVGNRSLEFMGGLADRVLAHLDLLKGDTAGYAVDRLTHSLQTATRAHRDGRNEEYVVCALIHDIGDTLASYNHADLAATILQPFVSDKNHWIVQHHGIFQGYYFFHHLGLDRNLRDRFKDHPYFADCVEFCAKYDQNSFDPAFDTMKLEVFEPMVRNVFSEAKNSIYLSENGE